MLIGSGKRIRTAVLFRVRAYEAPLVPSPVDPAMWAPLTDRSVLTVDGVSTVTRLTILIAEMVRIELYSSGFSDQRFYQVSFISKSFVFPNRQTVYNVYANRQTLRGTTRTRTEIILRVSTL